LAAHTNCSKPHTGKNDDKSHGKTYFKQSFSPLAAVGSLTVWALQLCNNTPAIAKMYKLFFMVLWFF
jgi:hypothetical protein